MEERVYIAGGILDISSGHDGTSVRARIPVRAG
jgi:signal transduction histidine kinase